MINESPTIASTRKAAEFYAALGWPVIPIWPMRGGQCACGVPNCGEPSGKKPPTGKHPIGRLVPNWDKDATTNLDIITAWWNAYPDANIAIATGAASGVYVVDIDPEKHGGESLDILFSEYGRFPDTVTAESGGGGWHYYFKHVPGLGNTSGKLGQGIDTRGDGGYILVAPSNHKSGRRYAWEASSHPGEIEPAEMPGWLVALLQAEKLTTQPVTFSANGNGSVPDLGRFKISEAMRVLIRTELDPADRSAVDQSVITALARAGAGDDDILAVFEHYPIGAKFAEKGKHGRQYLATSIANARAYVGRAVRSANGAAPGTAPGGGDATQAAATSGFRLDDTGNAERFVNQYYDRVRYVHTWGKWQVWNGRYWAEDETGQVEQMAKFTARRIYDEAAAAAGAGNDARAAELSKWARTSGSAAKRAAMLTLAQSETTIAITHKVLNRDPYLVACTNGTIDLRTCQLRPSDRADLITRCLPVDYDPAASCPLWLAFLGRIMPETANRIFLQKAVGVALSGDMVQSLFFLYGMGANGKSTFVETILSLLGEYAAKTNAETLLQQDRRGVPNDVAALVGKRLVVASELPDGRRLNESQVKDLTGGDSITARFLNQEFFTFKPEFKLWMYGNHKPVITGTDDGIWRRIRLIPFTVQIPESEQDSQLTVKLRAELPGILAWAVEGWRLYQAEGLNPPADVTQATAAYRSESDALGQFLDDCTIQAETFTVGSADLYQAYVTWTAANGLGALSSVRFARALQERGFTKRKTKNGAFWHDLGLVG